MTHDFVINTENVNEYKYRILTDGIDTDQYMRNPVVLYMHEMDDDENAGHEVIGRCIALSIKDKQLIASIEFDDEDEFAKIISGKVERGFLRMASMYADVIEASSDLALVLPGQAYETVTKCKLIEISIVPVGGNDDALKLSNANKKVNLNKLNLKNEKDMPQLKTIALALGLGETTPENEVVAGVASLKLAKEKADIEVIKLTAQLKAISTGEAEALVLEAIELGLIPEVLKPSTLAAFEADFEGQKAILSKLVTDIKTANGLKADGEKIKKVALAGKGSKGTNSSEESFDYLQKHDAVKLSKIRKEQPELYEKIAQDYGAGVRYTEKK